MAGDLAGSATGGPAQRNGGSGLGSQAFDKNDIHIAARTGDLQHVARILSEGVDINAPDELGRSPLRHAAEAEEREMVDLLISRGASIDLQIAACLGRDRELLSLLKQGRDVNDSDGCGETSLHLASQHDHPRTVSLLLSWGADIHSADVRGRTALHYAAEFHSLSVVPLLLEAGAIVDAVDDECQTPLAKAVEWDKRPDMSTEALLLDGGADPNQMDVRQYTPLHIAVRCGATDLARYLISRGARVGLHVASGLGDDALVSHFLNGGFDNSAKDGTGCTPLHWAAEGGQESVAHLLLRHGADPNAADQDGRTPLHLAVIGPKSLYESEKRSLEGRCRVAELLKRMGADLGAVDLSDEETPMEMAISYDRPELAAVLRCSGVS